MSEPAAQPTPQPFPFQLWTSLPMDLWRRGWETWSSLMLEAPMRWMTGNQQLLARSAGAWKTAPLAWWSLTTAPAASPEPAVLPALKSARPAKAPSARKTAPAADIVDAEIADAEIADAEAVDAGIVAAPPPDAPAPEAPPADIPTAEVAPPVYDTPVYDTPAAASAPARPRKAAAKAKTPAKPDTAVTPAKPDTAVTPAKPDNLQAIKGIGPKLGAILNDLGVTTYAQIAGWSADDIAYIESKLDFPGRVTREKWIDQAKSLMA